MGEAKTVGLDCGVADKTRVAVQVGVRVLVKTTFPVAVGTGVRSCETRVAIRILISPVAKGS